MYFEQLGDSKNPTLVFCHGANLVHTFANQYHFANDYHLIIPHFVGFGKEASRVYDVETNVLELRDLVLSIGKKVTLVGFSIGSQLAFVFLNRYPELVNGAFLVSPWVIKDNMIAQDELRENLKIVKALKDPLTCEVVAVANGLNANQAKEFIQNMQDHQLESTVQMIGQKIEMKDYPDFCKIDVPIVAVAGAKEDFDMIQSVKQLAEKGKDCKGEIWEGAAHNIPSLFRAKLNERLTKFLNEKILTQKQASKGEQ